MAPDFWRAVALLRLDRPAGLSALEEVFASATPPSDLDGACRGRLLGFTVGHHLDALLESATGLWMPWQGKVFDGSSHWGRNLFTRSGRIAIRLAVPAHRVRPLGAARYGAFPFTTSVGPSALRPDVEVLRIDYRDVADNPRWPVRKILDELVRVDDETYLGQALIEFRGALRRAAWFSLTQP